MSDTTDRIAAAIEQVGYDPHVVAKTVIADLNPNEYVGALEDALPALVRDVLGALRRSPLTDAISDATTQPYSASVRGKPARGKSVYAKHLGVFARPYGTADGYKPLGACGLADLDFIVADRRKRAEANAEEAARVLKLRNLLNRKKVDKVSDLPIGEVEKCLR